MPDRRKAAAAALGGTLTLSTLYGFLVGEAKLARRAIGVTQDRPPSADGIYGDDTPGSPLRCLMLGDSAMVGYGMTRADATPPAMLGWGLSHVLGRQVEVKTLAVVGAKTVDVLDEQLPRIGDFAPDIAVVIVGTNDVTHQVPTRVSARQLGEIVTVLVDQGCEVVVGTAPDLGTIRPIKQPLRSVARVLSRDLARRQQVAVTEAGGRAIQMGSLLSPLFTDRREVMFGLDRFHPSEAGYANMVSVLLPAVAAAVGGREAHASARDLVKPSPRRWNLRFPRRASA